MGRVQIPLSLLSEETSARWYPLGRGSAKDNVHGEIFLELTLTASHTASQVQITVSVCSTYVNRCSILPETPLYCTR